MNITELTDLEYQAYCFAEFKHGFAGQKRKYTGEPYIVHPISVNEILKRYYTENEYILAASFLHDVIEDCYAYSNRQVGIYEIEDQFGKEVTSLVIELTDEFVAEAYPTLNRAIRKAREAIRLSNISDEALHIKLADFIDNTSSIKVQDPNFYKTYQKEKMNVLTLINSRIANNDNLSLKLLYAEALRINS